MKLFLGLGVRPWSLKIKTKNYIDKELKSEIDSNSNSDSDSDSDSDANNEE